MKRFVIANWKMQVTAAEAETLARAVVEKWAAQGAQSPDTAAVLCAPFTAIERVGAAVRGTPVALGAQDCFWEDKGAYTGEVSPAELKSFGVEYCIVGHSERRGLVGETDEMVRKKVTALLRHGIRPVVCVGETREEREGGRRDAVVIGQVKSALEGNRPVGTQFIVIAYEPRWVIGTGQAVSPEDAASMHHLIIQTLHEIYPADVVERQFAVIYGGSVDSSNMRGFLGEEVIRGALVGGASLKPQEFVSLCEIAADMTR
jgi:triosephosphate isomerase